MPAAGEQVAERRHGLPDVGVTQVERVEAETQDVGRDLATARYLSVFARLGCDVIAVPYDITQISRIADELESSWHRMMLLINHLTEGRSERLRANVRRRLVADTRSAIASLGAGSRFPEFNQTTRQRPRR